MLTARRRGARVTCIALLVLLLAATWAGAAIALQVAPQQSLVSGQAQAQPAPSLDTYSPPPAARAKAIRYSRVQDKLYFADVAISLAIFAFLWWSWFGVWLRRLAERASNRLFVQCLLFVPIFCVVVSVLSFPVDYYRDFIVERRFGLSTETLGAWLSDWGKSLGLFIIVAIAIVWIFYRIARRSPRRWWLYFWLALIPVAAFVMLIEPYVVEPLFFKFTPLAKTQPALTARVERMLRHAGIFIPESRIFEMDAAAKTRELNAYVSGWGSSKRVVIWDTTLNKLTPDETLSVLGHETGHYALHHIPKIFALMVLLTLVGLFLGRLVANWAVRRWGKRTGISEIGDLAGLPLLALILTAGMFLASPVINGISRHYEHQADQYGLEITYGVVPDPNAAMVRSFRIIGEQDLSDPDPNPFIVFWLYSHPPIADRIRFAAHYKPSA
ncbi:MAG: M48 family metallopeptidase [Terriglobia bacterium]